MTRDEYIQERMAEYAKNIDEFSVGEIVLHEDGRDCMITNKTTNSIEVRLNRKTSEGVNCLQWYEMNRFNRIFKKK